MTRVGICGAAGQMGRTVASLVSDSDDLQLASACEAPGSDTIGKDCGELAGVGMLDVAVGDNVEKMVSRCDVAVDFSHADTTERLAQVCAAEGKGLVIGTTGLSETQLQTVQHAATKIPVLMSPNMSVGVNVTFKLVELATKALGDSVDIEIFEIHHSHKNDSPSGTAVRLGELVASARNTTLDEQAVHGRQGFTGERQTGTIGFHSARGGDIVGEHSVIYAGKGERVEITHRAQSRVNFGSGAIQATRFIAAKLDNNDVGFYDMDSVLGLG